MSAGQARTGCCANFIFASNCCVGASVLSQGQIRREAECRDWVLVYFESQLLGTSFLVAINAAVSCWVALPSSRLHLFVSACLGCICTRYKVCVQSSQVSPKPVLTHNYKPRLYKVEMQTKLRAKSQDIIMTMFIWNHWQSVYALQDCIGFVGSLDHFVHLWKAHAKRERQTQIIRR